jgi:hypothetical protein
MIYQLRRHVVYKPGCQETVEAWGVDRPMAAMQSRGAQRDTDADDPLRSGDCGCTQLLVMPCGSYVTWHRFMEWLSLAEAAGYELVSGFKNLSPYSTIVIRGP